jgi:hypothetical protein
VLLPHLLLVNKMIGRPILDSLMIFKTYVILCSIALKNSSF